MISTGGLIKPTSLVRRDTGTLHSAPFFFEPNATFQDLTCDFEKLQKRVSFDRNEWTHYSIP